MSDKDRLASDEATTAAQQYQYLALSNTLVGIADTFFQNQTGVSQNPNSGISKAYQVNNNTTYMASIVMAAYNTVDTKTLYQVYMTVSLATSSTGDNQTVLTKACNQNLTTEINELSYTGQSAVTMNCLVPFTTSDTQKWLYITVDVGVTQGNTDWFLDSLAVTLVKLYY